ncbi:hypothetical protein AWM68_06300 [Fictibacillus phosphorivorans]|uniref:RES domain-containing protein n=1 Tax=Fictibacillus phosphorivorans TaxID=1221500 RepID=A0A165NGM7_9BACL|nr:hypothetical protein [Fictibacillus phosphorivorans]KZE65987.1 hypothetical protein AWM68_06300 [Fictibacillus phosphorivorans]
METLFLNELPIKLFLKFVNIEEFKNKVQLFRKSNIKNSTDLQLMNAINKVLTFKTPNGMELKLPVIIKTYNKGTRFFRVRKIDPEDHYIPLKGMKIEQDAWNPPNNAVKTRGRLNKKAESLLYVAAGDPNIAIKEARIGEKDNFSLIVYEAKKDINVNMIGLFEHNINLNFEENMKLKLIMDFLRDEFCREAEDKKEYLYRVSELIAKYYFDLPPGVVQDAWCYPSVAYKGSVNACFRPELGRELLQLQGVIICELVNQGIKCNCVAHGYDENGHFLYYPFGSEVQKNVFPEII